MKRVKVGQVVVMSAASDAAEFRVVETKGFRVGLVDASIESTNQRVQWVDVSTIYSIKPE